MGSSVVCTCCGAVTTAVLPVIPGQAALSCVPVVVQLQQQCYLSHQCGQFCSVYLLWCSYNSSVTCHTNVGSSVVCTCCGAITTAVLPVTPMKAVLWCVPVVVQLQQQCYLSHQCGQFCGVYLLWCSYSSSVTCHTSVGSSVSHQCVYLLWCSYNSSVTCHTNVGSSVVCTCCGAVTTAVLPVTPMWAVL